jgi:hypothetical protein
MTSRIAVPFLAVTLLAAPAFALEPSPKSSPAASPAKIVSSPKPSATPAKHATRTKKPLKKIAAAARPSVQHHPHAGPATPASAPAANGAAK